MGTKKTVLILGADFNNVAGMESGVAKAFRQLNWNVIALSYRKMFPSNLIMKVDEAYAKGIDLVLVIKGERVDPLQTFPRASVPKALWFQDDVRWNKTNWALFQVLFPYYDYVFYFDQSGIEWMQDKIRGKVYFLPLGYDPEVYRPRSKKRDVCFLCSVIGSRLEVAYTLKYRYNALVGWVGDDYPKLLAETKIAVNWGLTFQSTQQRVFEAAGCGCVVVTSWVDEKYRVLKTPIYVKNLEHLTKEIDELLADEEKLKEKAQQIKTESQNHTWKHRILSLLNQIQGGDR